MGKMSFKDLPDKSEGKKITPGNTKVKINSLRIEGTNWEGKTPVKNVPSDEWNDETNIKLVFNCEGEDKGPGFEGWRIDYTDPESPMAKGLVGQISAKQYPFKTSSWNGQLFDRNQSIAVWLRDFCTATGCAAWLDKQDGKFEMNQMPELLHKFSKDAPFVGKWFNVCVAGETYETTKDGNSYTNYNLFFPDFSIRYKPSVNIIRTPIEPVGVAESKLTPFSKDVHVVAAKSKKKAAEEVEGFKPSRTGAPDIEF